MVEHRAHYRVYYEDTDAGGVMYHAQYLAFAERGRSDALQEAGLPVERLAAEHGCVFVVRAIQVEYRRPLRLGELVCVVSGAVQLRRASCRLSQRLECDGSTRAELVVTLACIRLVDGRPVAIPERWRAVLAKLT